MPVSTAYEFHCPLTASKEAMSQQECCFQILLPNKQCCNRNVLSDGVARVRVIPIVREEDFASPAPTNTIQQLLSQVQSRLVGVLGEDDMPVPACCICHAAHQFWLQLCTHALNRHAQMSRSSLLSCVSDFSSADLLALHTGCNTSCCVAASQSCADIWQNMQLQMGAVFGDMFA